MTLRAIAFALIAIKRVCFFTRWSHRLACWYFGVALAFVGSVEFKMEAKRVTLSRLDKRG